MAGSLRDPAVILTHCEAEAAPQGPGQGRHGRQAVHVRAPRRRQEEAAGHGEDPVDLFSRRDVVVAPAHLQTEAEMVSGDVLTFSELLTAATKDGSSHLFAIHLPLYLRSGVPACRPALEPHRVTPEGQLVLPKDVHTSCFCRHT